MSVPGQLRTAACPGPPRPRTSAQPPGLPDSGDDPRGDADEVRPPLTGRLRSGHWAALDVMAAAGAAGLVAASAVRQPLFFGVPHWAAVIVAAGATLPAAVRRRWPGTALAIILAATVAAGVGGFSTEPPLAAALVLYMTALRLPRRPALRLLGGTMIVVAAVIVAQMCLVAAIRHDASWAATTAARLLTSALVLMAAWAIGYAVKQQRAYAAGLRDQAERRARQQVADARRSITEERLRIARELHDVVAHSLSLIAVQAGVANYLVGSRPGEATRALSSIEEISRGALGEMRTLLGVLRAGAPSEDCPALDAGLGPTPGLAGLDRLIERAAAAGVRVDLEHRGQRRPLPAGVDLAAYRVIQEALTNVVKHAATTGCRVRLDYSSDTLALEVTDPGPGQRPGPGPGRPPDHAPLTAGDGRSADPGHGIPGMRERIATYGGQFEAGPLPGHGFRVAARLPLPVPAS